MQTDRYELDHKDNPWTRHVLHCTITIADSFVSALCFNGVALCDDSNQTRNWWRSYTGHTRMTSSRPGRERWSCAAGVIAWKPPSCRKLRTRTSHRDCPCPERVPCRSERWSLIGQETSCDKSDSGSPLSKAKTCKVLNVIQHTKLDVNCKLHVWNTLP